MNKQDVIELYAKYGVKATFDKNCLDSGFVYCDNEVALGGDKNNLPMSLHELAHWLVATKKARKEPNYGLGAHPNGWDTNPKLSSVGWKKGDTWESRASELHVLMVYTFFGKEIAAKLAMILNVDRPLNPDREWLGKKKLVGPTFWFRKR